jgi:Ca2+:H+ antiporter
MQTNRDGQGDPNEDTPLLNTPYIKNDHAYIRWPAVVLHTTWQVLLSNYVNVLLIFVPLGIIAGALHWNPTVVFILNFFAIMPLASLLSFATEELSVPLGQTLGGLMNATFGNAVELIVRLAHLILAPFPMNNPI